MFRSIASQAAESFGCSKCIRNIKIPEAACAQRLANTLLCELLGLPLFTSACRLLQPSLAGCVPSRRVPS